MTRETQNVENNHKNSKVKLLLKLPQNKILLLSFLNQQLNHNHNKHNEWNKDRHTDKYFDCLCFVLFKINILFIYC